MATPIPAPKRVARQARQVCLLPPSDLPVLFARWLSLPESSSQPGIYNPVRTFWLFQWQALSPNHSCQDAVSKAMSWCALEGQSLPSNNTSGYCQARARLPLSWLRDLGCHAREHVADQVRPEHLWHSLRVKVVDGSTLAMPDTAANQERWPQSASQKAGCGFPTMRIVGLFCLATGALLELASGPLSDHERTLWRQMWQKLLPGDLVLSDRGFGSYAEFCLLRDRGVHMVARLSSKRTQNVEFYKQLGPGDRLVWWLKGKRSSRPKWMDLEAWLDLPERILVREISYTVQVPGFRTKHVTVATTLTDDFVYPAEDFAELFRMRWQVELDLRNLKNSMGLEMLRCKSPEMVQKELTVYWIAYNLVRGLMLEASVKYPCDVRALSFKGAMTFVWNWAPQIANARNEEEAEYLHECLLYYIAHEMVRSKKNRCHPRALKRRPKNYQRLTAARGTFKEIKHRNRYTKERAQKEKQAK